jgi:hypothetical protein
MTKWICYVDMFIINDMRSCNECTTLHCVESYLYHRHSGIFVISFKLNIFPFSASILTFSTQNHLILIQPIFSINTIISTRPASHRHFFGYCTSWNFTYLASKWLRLKSVSCLVFPPIWIVSRDMNLNVHNT